jgi:hypothetical protein
MPAMGLVNTFSAKTDDINQNLGISVEINNNIDNILRMKYNQKISRGAGNISNRKWRGNAPVKGFTAEIHNLFPRVMGWSPAEYAWDCHFFVERYSCLDLMILPW